MVSGHMCILVDVSFSDNAANFYNLANANRTQKSKEYKAAGQLVITRRWDAKTFLSTDHDTQKRHKRDIHAFSASFSSLFAIKHRSSHFFPSITFRMLYSFSYFICIIWVKLILGTFYCICIERL